MRRRVAVPLVGVAVVLVLVVGAWVGLRVLDYLLAPPGRPACSAEERAFAAQLAVDAMLTQAPPGAVKVETVRAEPCVSLDASEWIGGAMTAWAYSNDLPPDEQIKRFYLDLGTRLGWDMSVDAYSGLAGTMTVHGTQVTFLLTLHDRSHEQQVFWAEIDYQGISKAS